MGAYIFRKAFLRGMTDIQTAKIHSYSQGYAFFQTVDNGLHGDTRCAPQNGRLGVGVGATKRSYAFRAE